jgi:hypothetical protein
MNNIKFHPYNPHAYVEREEDVHTKKKFIHRTAGPLKYNVQTTVIKNKTGLLYSIQKKCRSFAECFKPRRRQKGPLKHVVQTTVIRNKANHGADAVEMLQFATTKKFRTFVKYFKMQSRQKTFANYMAQIKTSSKTLPTLRQDYTAINQFPKYVLRGVFDRLHQLFIGNQSFHKRLADLYSKHGRNTHLPKKTKDDMYQFDYRTNTHLQQITQSCIILMRFIRECRTALLSINYEAYFKTAKHILKLCMAYIKVKNAFINSLNFNMTVRHLKFTVFEQFPLTGGLLAVIQNTDRRAFNDIEYKKFVANQNVSLNVKQKVTKQGDVSHKYRYTNFSKRLNGRPGKI